MAIQTSSTRTHLGSLMMVLLLFLAAVPAVAQDGGSGLTAPTLLAIADLPNDISSTRTAFTADALTPAAVPESPAVPATPAEAEREAALELQRDLTVNTLQRFSHVKAVAWPSVREYVWERCFFEPDVFAAYAHTQPGTEQEDAFVFSLMIDVEAWEQLDGDEQRRLLSSARAHFDAALSELGIQGDLRFMLASGLDRPARRG